jgi:hypothetical protein
MGPSIEVTFLAFAVVWSAAKLGEWIISQRRRKNGDSGDFTPEDRKVLTKTKESCRALSQTIDSDRDHGWSRDLHSLREDSQKLVHFALTTHDDLEDLKKETRAVCLAVVELKADLTAYLKRKDQLINQLPCVRRQEE